MATFDPPVADLTPPVVARDDDTYTALGNRLFRHYKNRAQARNVFLLTDGTVVPPADAAPIQREDDDDVARVFHGARGPHTVNATEQAALEAAGYTVDA